MTDKLKKTPIPMVMDPSSQDAAGKKKNRKKRANHQLFLAPGVTHMCAQSLHYLENGSLRAASTLMGPPLHKQHTHVSKGLRCCQLASTLLPPVLWKTHPQTQIWIVNGANTPSNLWPRYCPSPPLMLQDIKLNSKHHYHVAYKESVLIEKRL